jgi:hypothetical protein
MAATAASSLGRISASRDLGARMRVPATQAWAAVDEAREHHGWDRGVEVGVFQDDVWPLAAQLQRYTLHGLRRRAKDGATDCCGAGEADLGHIRMRAEFGAHHVATAVDDIEHASRKARLVQGLGEDLGLGGAHLAGLDHDSAAGGDSGRELAADEAVVAVPWRDRRDHAERL